VDKMDDRDVRKLVFDTLDNAISTWLKNTDGNFVQDSIKNGIVDKDELVEYFMFNLLNL
jgi:hypothetical protein